MRKPIKPKMRGRGLDMRTFMGKSGTYLVFRTQKGGYHAFLETSARDAAMDCNSGLERKKRTGEHWAVLWE
jgi:hypothetical protein